MVWSERPEVSSNISFYLSLYPHQTKKHRGHHKIFFSLSSPPLHQNSLSFLFFYIAPSLYDSHALHLLSLQIYLHPLIAPFSVSNRCAFIFLFRSMDREGGSNGGSCYYSVLGIRRDASFSDIRTAYRKLAMVKHNLLPPFSSLSVLIDFSILTNYVFSSIAKRWHPDKWARNPATAGEAKRRFQQIQEAYSGQVTPSP